MAWLQDAPGRKVDEQAIEPTNVSSSWGTIYYV